MVHVLVEPELTAVRFLYGRSRKFDRRIRRIEIEIPPAAYEGLCFLDDVFKAILNLSSSTAGLDVHAAFEARWRGAGIQQQLESTDSLIVE